MERTVSWTSRHRVAAALGLVAAGLIAGYAGMRIFPTGLIAVVAVDILGTRRGRGQGLALTTIGTSLGGLSVVLPIMTRGPICPASVAGQCHSGAAEPAAAILVVMLAMAATYLALTVIHPQRRSRIRAD